MRYGTESKKRETPGHKMIAECLPDEVIPAGDCIFQSVSGPPRADAVDSVREGCTELSATANTMNTRTPCLGRSHSRLGLLLVSSE